MVSNFRKIPPIELIDEIFKHILINKNWFTKDEIKMDNIINDWIIQLEPYYLPCKSERFIQNDMTKSRFITVLRHILKEHNIELKSNEKVINGKKVTIYEIYNNKLNNTLTFD